LAQLALIGLLQNNEPSRLVDVLALTVVPSTAIRA
jgi:hypothetical protein